MNTSFKVFFIALLPFLVQAQLSAKDASEGECIPQPELLPLLYSGVNLFSILPPTDYYVPMASQALYREYAEGLLGRPAATQEELDSMQLVLGCGPVFTAILNKGFPKMENPPSFSQTCVPVGLPTLKNLGLTRGKVNLDYVQAACVGLAAKRPNGTVALISTQAFADTVDSAIWVNDEETAFLVYRCPANGIKDYKVLSKTKTLAPKDIETIKQKILPLGFQQDHIAYMNYD